MNNTQTRLFLATLGVISCLIAIIFTGFMFSEENNSAPNLAYMNMCAIYTVGGMILLGLAEVVKVIAANKDK